MQLVVGGTVVKNTPAIAKDTGDRSSIPGSGRPGDLAERLLATQSSILAWEIPWTEKPGRL